MSDISFVIPCAGKMFYSSINGFSNQALCFVLNKGYLESSDLGSALKIRDILISNTIVTVGNIDKVKLHNNSIVYRQRFYFKSILEILRYCKVLNIELRVKSSFKIGINNVINIADNLNKLECFAKENGESIDTWLTNTCLVHLNNLVQIIGVRSNIVNKVEDILRNKKGYLDYAPLLISRYDIIKHTSSVFIEPSEIVDERMYSRAIYKNLILQVGFTSHVIKGYRKGLSYDKGKNK